MATPILWFEMVQYVAKLLTVSCNHIERKEVLDLWKFNHLVSKGYFEINYFITWIFIYFVWGG
jgi:hypothetical protein